MLGKDKYALKKKAMREKIIAIEEGQKGCGSGTVKCENYGKESFQYYYNNGFHINGSCNAGGCDFRMQTQGK
ncbi:hypothetical protein HY604_03200 [Candidatus Peregrinibacteria bacterium]|nr:hypothetical protein [Candidatus Peregrinibacteria bacterium]